MADPVRDTLERLANDESAPVREAAVAALDRLRARDAVEEHRARLLSAPDVAERLRVVWLAEELGGGEGISLLVSALSDVDGTVRGAAVRALEAHPTPAVLKILHARLSTERGPVLANVVEALGKSRRRELAPHIEKFMGHPDPDVASRAVVAFVRVAGPESAASLVPLAGSPDPSIRAAVAVALSEWSRTATV